MCVGYVVGFEYMVCEVWEQLIQCIYDFLLLCYRYDYFKIVMLFYGIDVFLVFEDCYCGDFRQIVLDMLIVSIFKDKILWILRWINL